MSAEPVSILMAPGPLPVEEALRIVRAIAESLHDVHGELWPSAIVIDGDDVHIDPPGGDRLHYGQYAAPERILGKPPTHASDVFSLGAILHHALSGRPPFRGDNPAAVMLAACTEAPVPLPTHIPRGLVAIVQRALEKDPSKRYFSPSELADALVSYAHHDLWQGKRLLAADDDAPTRVLYKRMAARIGVEADIVSSGRDAVEAFKTCHYDVALLDLNMPRISGWEVLDFLRSHHTIRPGHLYVITGFADQQMASVDAGLVKAVLYKPVELDELGALVTACLRDEAPDLAAILKTTSHRAVA
jgi:CheY-like chemotaxis protein